jgi:hypothetical protein
MLTWKVWTDEDNPVFEAPKTKHAPTSPIRVRHERHSYGHR